ncbi:MAG TPA: hypothetical protein ENF45_01265 [Bacteroidetes bacterium]|nr:hypothetical protein [Bacteroidota bacterium]
MRGELPTRGGGLPTKITSGRMVNYTVNLGGFDIEPYEAMPINPSPQLRQISPGTNTKVQIFLVARQYIARISDFKITYYSEQAKQDLQISLLIGDSKQIFVSGLVKPVTTGSSVPISLSRETRAISNTGMPYTSIAKVGGVGYPDNLPRDITRTFAIAYENDLISWQIINQSDLYTHAVKLELYGWTFPMQGRTRYENLKDIAR